MIKLVLIMPGPELPAPVEEKRLATWGTEVPDDLVLDEKLLSEALRKVTNLLCDSIFFLVFCSLSFFLSFFLFIFFI